MCTDTVIGALYGLMGGAGVTALAFKGALRRLHERLRVVENHCGIELQAPKRANRTEQLSLWIRRKLGIVPLETKVERGDFDEE
jgi:hypothetical protein